MYKGNKMKNINLTLTMINLKFHCIKVKKNSKSYLTRSYQFFEMKFIYIIHIQHTLFCNYVMIL